jgi:hypothetical protein
LSGLFTHRVFVVVFFMRRESMHSNGLTIVLFVFIVLIRIVRVLVFKLGIQILPFCGRVGRGGSVVFQLNYSRGISGLFLLRFLVAIFARLS